MQHAAAGVERISGTDADGCDDGVSVLIFRAVIKLATGPVASKGVRDLETGDVRPKESRTKSLGAISWSDAVNVTKLHREPESYGLINATKRARPGHREEP